MVLKDYKPVTPGLRQLVLVDNTGVLHKGAPYKSLVRGIGGTGGRNNLGRITVRHRGGSHKRVYRLMDFKRSVRDCDAVVQRIEYSPYASTHIALIKYDSGKHAYILAPQGVKSGSVVSAGVNADILPGNALPLSNIPIGTLVHNVELKVGKGGQFVRSAGGYAQVVGRDGINVIVKLPSGVRRKVLGDCYATVGVLSNQNHSNESLGKAGRNRWRGVKPSVRGVAMNPVDHPHGGGEGKASGGRHPCTPWGKLTKGKKTRRNKFTDKFIIQKDIRRGRKR